MSSINVEEALKVKNNFEKYISVSSLLIKGLNDNKNYKYSIVIPTFKRVSTLKESLESAINQDYEGNFNIIVCDNNPERNDETELFMQHFTDKRIKYYKNIENIGMTGNFNRCFELCDGKYLIMLHDDDILYPSFLRQCDKILNKHNDIKFLFPNKVFWYQAENPNPPQPEEIANARLYKLGLVDFLFNGMAPSGVLFDKEETIRLGGFNESAYPAQDLYFIIKAIENSDVYFYTMPLCIYRWGINETLKLKTLLGFVKVFNPLRIWMAKKIGLPKWVINYFNRQYSNQYYNIIKNTIPEELDNINVKQLELPKNKFEVYISTILTKLISYIIKYKNKINSSII